MSGTVLFLDARMPLAYAAGHIPSALNVPVDAFEENYVKVVSLLDSHAPIIAYCDGSECEQSQRLKDRLLQLGYTDVRILPNGWTTWHQAGLPTERSVTE